MCAELENEHLLPIIHQDHHTGCFVVRLDGVRHTYDTRGEATRFVCYHLIKRDIQYINGCYSVKVNKAGGPQSESKSFTSRKDAVDYAVKRNASQGRARLSIQL